VSRAVPRAAGGLLALAALTQLGPEPPASPLALAAAAALVVALLPRIGWLCAALALCAWVASAGAELPGTALVIAVAALPVPLLLPRAGPLWSLPVLAPLLGVVALAPAFVGVAALAPTAARRAGLAAAGFLWLALAEVATGESLLFGVADGTLPRSDWEDSLTTAASGALQPLATGPALAPLLAWVAFAAILPLVVRGRWLTVDLLGATLWAGGLAACHVALGDLLAATTALDQARGAVSGAVIGALVMVSVSQMAAPAQDWRGQPATSS
jgi:eukaryotic-like serine/threonine-protein kinase